MNVAQLIQALKKMPKDATVELSVSDYTKPAAGARKLMSQITTVQPDGSVFLEPSKAQTVVVIFSSDSHLANL